MRGELIWQGESKLEERGAYWNLKNGIFSIFLASFGCSLSKALRYSSRFRSAQGILTFPLNFNAAFHLARVDFMLPLCERAWGRRRAKGPRRYIFNATKSNTWKHSREVILNGLAGCRAERCRVSGLLFWRCYEQAFPEALCSTTLNTVMPKWR